MNDFDFTGMSEQERNQYTVGELIDAIDRKFADTRDLMRLAEIGKYMLYEAVCTADDQDNLEFFVEAYSFYGPLIDTVLQECGRENRDALTGRARATR
jgi:hypothetical protein